MGASAKAGRGGGARRKGPAAHQVPAATLFGGGTLFFFWLPSLINPRLVFLSPRRRAKEKLEAILDGLVMEQDEIGDAMLFCLEHADAAEEVGSTPTTALRCLLPPPWLAVVTESPPFFIFYRLQVVKHIAASFEHLETPTTLKIARLYLISDILHNCTARVRNASKYRLLFSSHFETIFDHLNKTFKAISGRLRAEQFRVRAPGLRPSLARAPLGPPSLTPCSPPFPLASAGLHDMH